MTDKQFYTLWAKALDSAGRSTYISDWFASSIWGDAEGAEIPADRAEELGKLWDAAHMSIRDIREYTALSQAAFAQRFCIPRRSVEDWEAGRRSCPDYLRLLLAQVSGAYQRTDFCQ